MSNVLLFAYLFVGNLGVIAVDPAPALREDGYRGIWYMNQPTGDEFAYKYSGGLGTYCAHHIPMAVYSPEAEKTFFVYGGRSKEKNELLEMVSFYDHKTGMVPRPVTLINKGTDDAHDNPVIALDKAGHILVFASSHGTGRPSYIYRSVAPYSIDAFDRVLETNFSYPQPWRLPAGFLFLHTSYGNGRGLFWSTSHDGVAWSERRPLAHIQEGHYQVSWPHKNKVGTAFNYHPTAFQGDPARKGLNWRTNLYYVETEDMGATWRNASGEAVQTPITDVHSPTLVRDFEKDGTLIYLADMNFDEMGRPVIVYVAARSWRPGPDAGPRMVCVAVWTGTTWEFRDVGPTDHNYDMGSVYIERDLWRLIYPMEAGPQPFGTGGDVVTMISSDDGMTWARQSSLTRAAARNFMYCRRPLNAHEDFYAFWADGNSRTPSESRLYFCDKLGQGYRLPESMSANVQAPERVE